MDSKIVTSKLSIAEVNDVIESLLLKGISVDDKQSRSDSKITELTCATQRTDVSTLSEEDTNSGSRADMSSLLDRRSTRSSSSTTGRCQFANRGTVFTSIVILMTTSVGAGTLSLPFAFAQGGIVYSSIAFFVVMVTIVYVGTMILDSKRYASEVYPDNEVWSYSDLAGVSYGPIGKIIVLLSMFIYLLLVLIGYMIFARDQLRDVIAFALTATGHIPECSPLLNCGVVLCIAFLPIFPLTLLRNLTSLQFTAYFSVICISFVGVAMTVDTTLYWTTNTNISISDQTIQLFPVDFTGSIVAVSYCSTSFVCQFNLLQLQKELKGSHTKPRLFTINLGAILGAYFLYNIVIFAGYFRFFNELMPNVMLNYSRQNYIMICARLAIVVVLLSNYPVYLHPARETFNNAMLLIKDLVKNKQLRNTTTRDSRPAKVPTIIWFGETCIIFAVSFLAASFIPNVGIVWNFLGSISGMLILYVFPQAFYLKLRFDRYRLRSKQNGVTILSQYNAKAVMKELTAVGIILVGILLLCLTNYQAIYAVVDAANDEDGQCSQTCPQDRDDRNVTFSGY